MKENYVNGGGYEAPSLEVTEIRVEAGFAASGPVIPGVSANPFQPGNW